MRQLISLASLTLIACIAAAAFWLTQSELGLQSVVQIASQASSGRLIMEKVADASAARCASKACAGKAPA